MINLEMYIMQNNLSWSLRHTHFTRVRMRTSVAVTSVIKLMIFVCELTLTLHTGQCKVTQLYGEACGGIIAYITSL